MACLIETADWNDPNTWEFPEHEFRIYGDTNALSYAVVDEIDYQWALEWLWSPKWSRGGRKCYLRRNGQEGCGQDRIRKTIFLHVAIQKRTGIPKPTPSHSIVDHRDGNAFNCRRSNLRWATQSMNSLNVNGQCPYDLFEQGAV